MPAQDPPSIGPKWGLLVVDASFWPTDRPSGRSLHGSLESLDGALSFGRQPDYTLELRDAQSKALLGTDTITGTTGITRFTDARGYVPGFRQDPASPEATPAALDADASVVVPSLDGALYSTRITGPGRSRPHPLDGSAAAQGGHYFGSGDPGDANLQYGVRIELVDQAPDGSWGALRVVNDAIDYELSVGERHRMPGHAITATLVVTNRGAAAVVVDFDSLSRLPGHEEYGPLAGGAMSLDPGQSREHRISVYVPTDAADYGGDNDTLTIRVRIRRSVMVDGQYVPDGDEWIRETSLAAPVRAFLPMLRRE